MTRLNIAFLALSLFTTAQAANMIFGAYSTSSCESCLDQTFDSCPGDYQTRSYAECMCYGDGGTNFVSCIPDCDASLNEPENASIAWYSYCVMFFKDMCDGAESYLDSDTFNEQCSSEAIAAGGIGEDTASETTAGADSTATTEPTESASGTATKAMNVATTQSTSGATATAVAAPALAVMAGLGMQLINMNL